MTSNDRDAIAKKAGFGHSLALVRLGIDTSQEAVVYMREDCSICRSEGFTAHARVLVRRRDISVIATVNVIRSDLLSPGEAGLSEAAWRHLGGKQGDEISIHHPLPLESLSAMRAKAYGHRLEPAALGRIITDIAAGRYSDIHLSAFVTACAGANLNRSEIKALTEAMIDVGERLDWGASPIVDKHCVGGLPGNRTTPIVVAIVAAYGLTMPKTSSRAITSPAGTADTMETLAPVDLNLSNMRRVVEREGGCIVWGGAVRLSPADDILIRVERALDLDSEGQLVASVLSKKAAAGSTHLVLDLPTGPTAKVRNENAAKILGEHLVAVSKSLEIKTRALVTDGLEPVGFGIGPALEARDVLAALRSEQGAPKDLCDRAVRLAGEIFELVGEATTGEGREIARKLLRSGRAWQKFQAICEAQGGMRVPPSAPHTFIIEASRAGVLRTIDNRQLARVAKLSGAPSAPAAGLVMHKKLRDSVASGEPLFTIHAETSGELNYALEFVHSRKDILEIGDHG